MKEYKRMLVSFAFYDRTGIENFLEKQALKGWLLESTSGIGWRFIRNEPRQLKFSVTFFPETIDVNAAPSKKFIEYLEYCKHSGWRFVDTVSTMQIFYSESTNAVPIETDALLELETIHKAVKETTLYSQFVLMVLSFLMFCMTFFDLLTPSEFTEVIKDTLYCVSYFSYFLVNSFEFARYYHWRNKAKKMAEMFGTFTPTKSRPYLHGVLKILSLVVVVMYLYSSNNSWESTMIMLVLMFILVFSISAIVAVVKGKKKDQMIKSIREDVKNT